MQKGQLVKQISPHVYSANLHAPLPSPGGWRLYIPLRGCAGRLRSMNPVRLRLYSCLYFAANRHISPGTIQGKDNTSDAIKALYRATWAVGIGHKESPERLTRGVLVMYYLFCFNNSDNTTKGKSNIHMIISIRLSPKYNSVFLLCRNNHICFVFCLNSLVLLAKYRTAPRTYNRCINYLSIYPTCKGAGLPAISFLYPPYFLNGFGKLK